MRNALTLALILSLATGGIAPVAGASAQELTPLLDSVSSARESEAPSSADRERDEDLGGADRVAAQTGDNVWNAATTVSQTFAINAMVPGAPTIGRSNPAGLGPM